MFTCWWSIRQQMAISNLVNSLKGVSSRLLRKERPGIQRKACCSRCPASHQAVTGADLHRAPVH